MLIIKEVIGIEMELEEQGEPEWVNEGFEAEFPDHSWTDDGPCWVDAYEF